MNKKRKKKHDQKLERTSQNIDQEKYIPFLKKCKEDSQNYIVLKHLIYKGAITRRDAMNIYYIANLPARIKDLRDLGVDILTNNIPTKKGSTYASYELKGEE